MYIKGEQAYADMVRKRAMRAEVARSDALTKERNKKLAVEEEARQRRLGNLASLQGSTAVNDFADAKKLEVELTAKAAEKQKVKADKAIKRKVERAQKRVAAEDKREARRKASLEGLQKDHMAASKRAMEERKKQQE